MGHGPLRGEELGCCLGLGCRYCCWGIGEGARAAWGWYHGFRVKRLPGLLLRLTRMAAVEETDPGSRPQLGEEAMRNSSTSVLSWYSNERQTYEHSLNINRSIPTEGGGGFAF